MKRKVAPSKKGVQIKDGAACRHFVSVEKNQSPAMSNFGANFIS
jgi:hypothetical protein